MQKLTYLIAYLTWVSRQAGVAQVHLDHLCTRLPFVMLFSGPGGSTVVASYTIDVVISRGYLVRALLLLPVCCAVVS